MNLWNCFALVHSVRLDHKNISHRFASKKTAHIRVENLFLSLGNRWKELRYENNCVGKSTVASKSHWASHGMSLFTIKDKVRKVQMGTVENGRISFSPIWHMHKHILEWQQVDAMRLNVTQSVCVLAYIAYKLDVRSLAHAKQWWWSLPNRFIVMATDVTSQKEDLRFFGFEVWVESMCQAANVFYLFIRLMHTE